MIRLAALLVVLAFPAWGQDQLCAPRVDVLNFLSERFGETRQSMGMTKDAMMEVYASDETGTWSIVLTLENGISCIVAAGNFYNPLIGKRT